MNKTRLVAALAAATIAVLLSAGCSSSAGGNRQITPAAVHPLSEAQRQAEIKEMLAKNPHFHVPQQGPGSLGYSAGGVPPPLAAGNQAKKPGG